MNNLRKSWPVLILVLIVAVWQYFTQDGQNPDDQNGSSPRKDYGLDDRSSDDSRRDSGSNSRRDNPRSSAKESSPKTSDEKARTADATIAELVRERKSKVVVDGVRARVIKLFRDDTVGSKHQLFLVKLKTGNTLKISHNIDLAPRVPVKVGDEVEIRGQFEWNEKGGVLHWTHHDPRGRRPGGWIRHEDKVYK